MLVLTRKRLESVVVGGTIGFERLLKVTVLELKNGSVQLGFEVDSSLMDEGKVHEGILKVTANGGQQLAVRVQVDVRAPQRPFTRRLLGPFLTAGMSGLPRAPRERGV